MTRLWIVRHGNTFGPDEPPRRIGARTDLPLIASGAAQAAALAAHFHDAGIAFDVALCSPLRRTRQTAETILAGTLEPRSTPWLAEIDHGPDENRTEAEVLARIGADALDAWDRDAVPPPGWIVDAEVRIAAWRDLFAYPPGRDVLLVTSNGAARFALSALPARPATLKLRTGAYGVIALDDAGPRLEAWDVRP